MSINSKMNNKKKNKNSIPMIVTKNTIPFGDSTVSIIVQRLTSLKAVTQLAMFDSEEKHKICLVAQKSKDDINDVYRYARIATVNNITYFNTNIQVNNQSKTENDENLEDKNFDENQKLQNIDIAYQNSINIKNKKEINELPDEEKNNLENNNEAASKAIDYSNMIAKITVTCEEKILIKKVRNISGYQELCDYEVIEDYVENEEELKKLMVTLQNEFNRYLQILESKHSHQKEKLDKIRKTSASQSNFLRKTNIIAAFLYNDDPSSVEEAEDEDLTMNRLIKGQKILEENSLNKKTQMIIDEIKYKIAEISIEKTINFQTEEELKKDYQKAILRKKIEIIRKRLGDGMENSTDKYYKMLDYIADPVEKERINNEIKKLRYTQPSSAEYSGLINFLDLAYKIYVKPTEITDFRNFDAEEVKKRLDSEHFGINKVKDNIVAYYASLAYTKPEAKSNAKILCLIGPPGVGKTTIAMSIARANNWGCCTVSMAAVKDEAELRGHRRTYVGSLPGKIVSNIANMPKKDGGVIILDEVDKMSTEASAVLLEMLDPNQNKSFTDHYFGKIDLSKYMFILTANYLDRMPEPLLDRTEKLFLSGYSLKEKIKIVKDYIIPSLEKSFNLHFCNLPNCQEAHAIKLSSDVKNQNDNEFAIDEANEEDQQFGSIITIKRKMVKYIIEHYTRELGVRELKRCMEMLCRKEILEKSKLISYNNKQNTPFHEVGLQFDMKKVHDHLGLPKFDRDNMNKIDMVGLVHGLSYSSHGGGVLPIECKKTPGEGQVKITGRQGEVMKESVSIAMDVVLSLLEMCNIDVKSLKKNWDLHIHVPDGSTPKEGPSAGCAFFTTIFSCYTGIKVRFDVGMTGEITLHGKVTAIGGVKEKVLAAIANGLKCVILSEENKKDVDELLKEKILLPHEIEFVFVKTLQDVLKVALVEELDLPDIIDVKNSTTTNENDIYTQLKIKKTNQLEKEKNKEKLNKSKNDPDKSKNKANKKKEDDSKSTNEDEN